MKRLALTVILALICGCIGGDEPTEQVCDSIDDPKWRAGCIINKAIEEEDSRRCESIVDDTYRDKCYLRVALKSKDARLCDKILFAEDRSKCLQEYRSGLGLTSTTTTQGKAQTPKTSSTTTSTSSSTTITQTTTSTTLVEPEVDIYFLDVSDGDSALLVSANQTILMDCGKTAQATQRQITKIGVEKIDTLILSQATIEEFGGCAHVIEVFNPEKVLDNGQQPMKDKHPYLTYRNKRLFKDYVAVSQGSQIAFDDITITFHNPQEARPEKGSVKDNALVYTIEYGDNKLLMTGDCSKTCEQNLGSEVEADILKIPDHGGRYSTSQDFLEKVNPDAAIITVGPNSREYPDDKVVKRLNQNGIDTYQVGEQGIVHVKLKKIGYEINYKV